METCETCQLKDVYTFPIKGKSLVAQDTTDGQVKQMDELIICGGGEGISAHLGRHVEERKKEKGVEC